MDDQVDNMMLKMLLEQLDAENSDSQEHNEVQPRRTMHLNKKMLMPLLMGVVLKMGSLVPLILGKLAFIGSTALMASKLSLLIVGVIAMKKLFSGSEGGGMSQMSHHQGHHYGGYQDQQTYYSDMHGQGSMQVQYQHPQQRISYIVRGRQLGGEEFWKPSEGTEERKGGNTARPQTPRQEKLNESHETSPSKENAIPYS
ncbi:hypothetical protein C0J52_17072 [Blattella germanica]|nr:hypothetical protein C0J52_17072 [Blattella germanica]